MATQTAAFDTGLEALERAEAETASTINYMRTLGLKLPDVVLDMSDWLTVKRYAEKYNVSTNVVSNWIARGIVPTSCVQIVPELNDMKLIKDKPYKQ